MATLALSLAGQFVGGALGGPFGATIGRALGALAGSAVDNALFGDHPDTRQGADIRLQGSMEGGAIPRLYGWSRLTGNIIWATELEEITTESSGAKGTSQADETEIAASFAIGLCEGTAHRLGRIWADGQLLETENLALRFYCGTESQNADSLIEAKQGTEGAPAYRGLCYIIFERLPLSSFGNRIPNISVELCRVVGDLEPAIRAVTLIPGATEFGYDPVPRMRLVGPGATASENTHLSRDLSDWTLSLDELQALCPNLEQVSLVVTWFGDDLRCGTCLIKPRVEAASRDVEGTSWIVSGISRAAAPVVSSHDGGPAFGGTPSDAAVLAAITDLKARGLKVTLYPMIQMDIAATNTLIDPYDGSAGQPAYPWRGRITCNPAPGAIGSPDQSAAAASQIAGFVGAANAGQFSAAGSTVNFSGGADWGYRRMLLHYAKLAALAGGVDAFLIGSELRGLTTVRGTGNSFPFVTELTTLASDIRAVLGAGTKLTYAADWSEYSGYQPAGGDKFFHLDPLWSASAIDAVGIDNYMPLTDWRDGDDHADAAIFDGPHDVQYLRARIAGGEGYDWYYQTDADRLAGARTPITDAAHDEPWVWRFKDLVSWWSQPHHNRIAGLRSASATAWVPESKPIWFTELGCGAVDKGSNQPNVFSDPKSIESGRPYFSSGAPDPLQQRQFLRALLGYWQAMDDAANPISTIYAGRMVDPDNIYLWTWDARPFPAFPNDTQIWSDGPNHRTGHWLTGRLGAVASDELARAIAGDYGVALDQAAAAAPLVHGLRTEGVMACRDALAPVLSANGLTPRDDPNGLSLIRVSTRSPAQVDAARLVALGKPVSSRRRPDASEQIGQIALTYSDRQRDYLWGAVTAMRISGGAISSESSPLVLDAAGARSAAERMLTDATIRRDTIDVTLPHSALALEVGDAIAITGQGDGPFEITEIRDTDMRQISARAIPPISGAVLVTDRNSAASGVPAVRSMPAVVAVHLPTDPENFGASRLFLAASAQPWPGDIVVNDDATGLPLARLARNATMGQLTAPFSSGPIYAWDKVNTLTLALYSGHLASADDDIVLAGGYRLAVETDSGAWEVVGFANAELVAPSTYRLTRLLRGQMGTGPAIGVAAAGNRIVLLDGKPIMVPVQGGWLDQTQTLRAYVGPADAMGLTFSANVGLGPVRPLAPDGLNSGRLPVNNSVVFSWKRRSRADTESWAPDDAPPDFTPEAYELNIYSGAVLVRSIQTVAPTATYSSAQQIADFGSLPASFTFTLAQKSPLFGTGQFAQGTFHA